MQLDLHNNLEIRTALASKATPGDNTVQTGVIIDLANREGCEFAINIGTGGSASSTWTPSIVAGNVANLSDGVAASGDDLNGTIAAATATLAADNSKAKKLGYLGAKRYVRLDITPAGNSAALQLGAVCILGGGRNNPLS